MNWKWFVATKADWRAMRKTCAVSRRWRIHYWLRTNFANRKTNQYRWGGIFNLSQAVLRLSAFRVKKCSCFADICSSCALRDGKYSVCGRTRTYWILLVLWRPGYSIPGAPYSWTTTDNIRSTTQTIASSRSRATRHYILVQRTVLLLIVQESTSEDNTRDKTVQNNSEKTGEMWWYQGNLFFIMQVPGICYAF